MAAQYAEYKNSTGIWQHFLRENDGQSAQCKLCKNKLKTVGGSTKGLHEHLKRMHDMSVMKRKAAADSGEEDDAGAASQPSREKVAAKAKPNVGPMTKYCINVSANTLQATIARMTARDGLPFRPFITSPDLRKCLMAMGFANLPKSADTVKEMVMDQGRRVRSLVTGEIAKRRAQGQRFSLTFDEWTSGRNRRYIYMNINVHGEGGTFWSLGLVRVNVSMPAEKCVELLESKLAQFGLTIQDDIVCICTDGASVMVKVGKIIEAEQQLCYAHGVQLAVLDVLYRRQARTTPQPSDHDEADDHSDADGEDDAQGDPGFQVIQDYEYDILVEMSPEYHNVVNKVRKIVKLFKRSPTKNDDILQPYVKRELGREVSLTLDCRTRWNSMVDMLSRFLQLRGPVQKALIDLGQQYESVITDGEFNVIQEMVSCLEPVKLVVNALCRRDTNLVSAEAALKFCITQLQKQSSELARMLAEVLEHRIKERRGQHSAVMQYLHNSSARQSATEVFQIPSNDVIKKFVRSLVMRLDKATSTPSPAEPSTSETQTAAGVSHSSDRSAAEDSVSVSVDLQQQLEAAMRQSVDLEASAAASRDVSLHSQDVERKLDSSIKAEMAVFQTSGKRGRCLEPVYRYLLSVPPTSVEAESAF